MKTIKAIIFGALIITASVSGFLLFCFLGTVDVTDLWGAIKMFLSSAFTFGASCLAIRYLYERWYRQ